MREERRALDAAEFGAPDRAAAAAAAAPGPRAETGFGAPGAGDAFATFLGMRWEDTATVRLALRPDLLNLSGMLLGPVGFALADYSMGAALWPLLDPAEAMATTSLSINYVAPAIEGDVVCSSTVDRRGRRHASLRSEAFSGDRLVFTAQGTFAIFPRRFTR